MVVIYKLVTYNEYTTLFEQFSSNFTTNWYFLMLCLALMPCNILSESLKWQCAISHIEKISFKKAIITTLRGQVGGIANPNKLGDIPTRALSLHEGNRTAATIMGFIAAWTLSLVIIVIGAIASAEYLSIHYPKLLDKEYKSLVFICCIGIAAMIFFPIFIRFVNTGKINSPKIKNIIDSIVQTSLSQIFIIIFWSIVRYSIFCTQLFLMLRFFNVGISVEQAIISIPTIYLLTTITPTITASEATTRSSYAILILAPFCSSTPTIALATTLLWALNCGMPIIVGSTLFNLNKKH